VEIFHEESLTTGRRSPFMEFYNRRNRWYFIARYFPEHMIRQKWFFLYRLQSLLFRGEFVRAYQEWLAMRDWKTGRMGPTHRQLERKRRG
jgi:GT2 family glycosyltransferase